jgi:hypothetical protein
MRTLVMPVLTSEATKMSRFHLVNVALSGQVLPLQYRQVM